MAGVAIPKHVNIDRTFVAYEGANIRVWYYQGRWRLSTFKKLDGYDSTYGKMKRSFGEIFDGRVPDDFYLNLNTNRQYLFLIVYHSLPYWDEVYHIGTFINEKFTFDDHIEGVEKLSSKDRGQGVIVYTRSLKSYKILNKDYVTKLQTKDVVQQYLESNIKV